MGNKLAGRIGFIVAVLVIFIYGIFGIPHGGIKQSITDRIHLGLDLQGGTRLVLQVHVAEAINSTSDRDVQTLNTALATTGATATKTDPLHPEVITITGVTDTQRSAVHDAITAASYSPYAVASANGGYTLTMTPSAITQLEQRTLDTSIETIRERIDKLGVSEPHVEPYGVGENQILVELPGVTDEDRVEGIINSTAKLEIHDVVGSYGSEQEAMTALNNNIPPDQELLKGSNGAGGPDMFFLLKRAAVVEGTDFRDAQAATDDNGRPDITFNLTSEAGDRFYAFTKSIVGTGQMAIVLDNKVREVAGVQEPIHDQGRITGGFTQQQQAADLSLMLRTGSLPASISYLETRSVGPSLGAASIHQGIVAAVAGMIAVMIFMLVYYRGAGINADLALVLNLIILLGFMGFAGATLTLPGIAGVILTIGMGVDSNVLIFERVREELRLGLTPSAAIEKGFGMTGALATIVDTHVTTIVSAGILFIFGTGPVKGFAVTLTFGLLANVFTAVFVSRTIFDYLLSKKGKGEALSI